MDLAGTADAGAPAAASDALFPRGRESCSPSRRTPTTSPLLTLARRLGVRWFRGSEHDVLSRYAGAAREADADLVVRVTADCPLIDPEETDTVVAALEERRATCDYASNGLERSLPRGLETEVLWRDVLERMDRLATSAAAREHVTWFCYGERPGPLRAALCPTPVRRRTTCAGRSTPRRPCGGTRALRRPWPGRSAAGAGGHHRLRPPAPGPRRAERAHQAEERPGHEPSP